MDVVLSNSRRVIGAWAQPISIDNAIPLPLQLGAPAYRYDAVVRWEPIGPPPQSRGELVEVPFWCDRNDKGDVEMIIEDGDEDLFRAHRLFRAKR